MEIPPWNQVGFPWVTSALEEKKWLRRLRNSNRHASRSARHSPQWDREILLHTLIAGLCQKTQHLFGAWGPIEKGHDRLVETFRWVGGRFKSGALVPEDVVAFESGDLAYTVGFEHGEVVVDKGAPAPMTIRVTHIYRRIDGEWRLIHRHADFPAPAAPTRGQAQPSGHR